MFQRPLLPVATVCLAGILLGSVFTFPLALLLAGCFLLLALALAWSRTRAFLLYPLLLLAGMANITLHTAVISPVDLRVLIRDEDKNVTVRGTLAETPYQRLHELRHREVVRTQARVDVTVIRIDDGPWQPAIGTIAVSTPGELDADFFDGQPVEVSGAIGPPDPPMIPGAFDYRAYLYHLGIYYQLWTRSPGDWQLLSPPGKQPPVADRFFAWGQKTLALGVTDGGEPLQLLWTMTLGWKTGLSGEVSKPFMESGTLHIFAISGLHIALIAAILVALLRVLRISRERCGLIVIPLIWFYTGVTGWQASAIRSTVMMSVIIVGWSLRRPSDLLNSLAAAGFVILLWQPQQLFQASFQLSFFVVLAIGLFSPALEKWRERLLATDPLLPDKLRPKWQLRLHEVAFWISASLATSLAAFLGSVPLIAYYFHLFGPVSLLANLAVVPLSSAALAANLASLVTGGWWPWLAGLFNNSAWLLMWLMIRISEWCAALPYGHIYIRTPTPFAIATYYAVLVSVMCGWLKSPRWRAWLGLVLVIMVVTAGWQWWRIEATTRLTVLPLSGGSAVFADRPGWADDLLMDCGNEMAADAAMLPFLHAQGVNTLDRLVLTHGDIKSVGGADVIRTNFSVPTIITSPIKFRSAPYRKLVAGFETHPGLHKQMARNDTATGWKVLHPMTDDTFSQADDSAIVMAGEINGLRILLLSDLGHAGQGALLQREPDLHADIVVTGLPEKSEPLSDSFLEAVKPAVIVVADSQSPATRRASGRLKERLARQRVPVFYTRDVGAVVLSVYKNTAAVTGMEGTTVSLEMTDEKWQVTKTVEPKTESGKPKTENDGEAAEDGAQTTNQDDAPE